MTSDIDRRQILRAGAALAATTLLGPLATPARASTAHPPISLYAGSWNWKGGKRSFVQYAFDPETGTLTELRHVTDSYSVGSVTIDARTRTLYLADEDDHQPDFRVGGGGTIAPFRIDPATGDLTALPVQRAFGANPSMMAVDPSGKFMVVSIHGSGDPLTKIVERVPHVYDIAIDMPESSINLFPLNADGTVAAPIDVFHTKPQDPAENQRVSHPHCVVFAPDADFFISCDKGRDVIYSMRIDAQKGRLVQAAAPFRFEAGAMPRYARFNPDHGLVYVNFERANEIAVLRYDSTGRLERVGQAPVVPEALLDKIPLGGHFEQQDMRLHPNGRFLYSVARGSRDYMQGGKRHYEHGFDGVSVFGIDPETGMLSPLQTLELEAHWPRGCALSPDGRFLIVPCLYSDEILTLAVAEDGTLSQVSRVAQNAAANVTFLSL
ncbi:beta-propeller fold lactonase family protein [Thioclava sp. GXIMD4215]|uniref:lactonase family protein n=1 Tax=Thioclava sp. GXIMD4215 TaxID=3131928 RepID=UPI00311AF696